MFSMEQRSAKDRRQRGGADLFDFVPSEDGDEKDSDVQKVVPHFPSQRPGR